MQKVSAYILTFNEAEKIKAAVESVLWADEIVVVDSNSTDATAAIATRFGARVVQVPSTASAICAIAPSKHAHATGFSVWMPTSAARRSSRRNLTLLASVPPLDVIASHGAAFSWADGSAARAGIRISASRSSSVKAACVTRSSRYMKATKTSVASRSERCKTRSGNSRSESAEIIRKADRYHRSAHRSSPANTSRC